MGRHEANTQPITFIEATNNQVWINVGHAPQTPIYDGLREQSSLESDSLALPALSDEECDRRFAAIVQSLGWSRGRIADAFPLARRRLPRHSLDGVVSFGDEPEDWGDQTLTDRPN